jgi:hypothetical protein
MVTIKDDGNRPLSRKFYMSAASSTMATASSTMATASCGGNEPSWLGRGLLQLLFHACMYHAPFEKQDEEKKRCTFKANSECFIHKASHVYIYE